MCPYCQQDAVWKVKMRSTPTIVFTMCYECDAVWLDGAPITNKAGMTFDKYLKSLGRIPNWQDIQKVQVIE